jgi:hypothetical protein
MATSAMDSDPLGILLDARPSWVSDVSQDQGVAHITAVPPTQNGLAFGVIDLSLRATPGGVVKVAEREPLRLPAFCPERHINFDSSFCLGLKPRVIGEAGSTMRWWRDLEHFLFLQAAAEQTGVWPAANALSHGRAADFEIIARAAARALCAERDYELVLDGEENWIARALREADADTGDLPVGWRAQFSPPSDLGDANWQSAVQQLAAAERDRCEAVTEFWDWAKTLDRTCCSTMRACPLAALNQEMTKPEGAS